MKIDHQLLAQHELIYQGKSLADVSQYFYICCTFSPSKSDKMKEGTNHISMAGENLQSEMEREKSSQSIFKKKLQFKISSEESSPAKQSTSQEEKRTQRKSLDLSSLETDHQRNLQQTEKLIRAKSAPVVTLDELDELL